jgi:hypothetical protein
MRLVLHDKKKGLQSLKSMSQHYVNNALYQSKLPLSDSIHGVNKMCPPETLHVMDAGITVYMHDIGQWSTLVPGVTSWLTLEYHRISTS